MLLLLCVCDSLNKPYTLLQQIPSSEVFWISPWNLIPDKQLVQDLERPDGPFSVAPVVASCLSLSSKVFILFAEGPVMKFSPLWKCILCAYCIMSHLISEHLITSTALFSLEEGGGWGHRSTVLNSLMQFNNATYSFHVSLGSFTCEITEPCLAWLTQRSRGRVTPKRQMWEGERN